jgi:hypothetical protein
MDRYIGLVIFFLSLQCNFSAQQFRISFSQGDQTIHRDSSGSIQLKKQPFIIEVELNSLDGVFVHCSEVSNIAESAINRKIPDFENIGWKVGVETEFNRDQELFLNTSNDYCYWFYDHHQDWHRFDSAVVVMGNHVQGQKTVRQFYSIEQEKNIPIKQASKNLYFTFFSINGSFNDKSAILNQVEIYQLSFED